MRLFLVLLCLSLSSRLFAATGYFPPPEAEGGWRVNTDPAYLESVGFDPKKLKLWSFWNMWIPDGIKHRSAIAIKDGWIVAEKYGTKKAKHLKNDLASNAKSFALALFGILVEDSANGNVNVKIDASSKVYDYAWLPEGFPLSDPRKADITFDQVFQHTSGLCPEIFGNGKYHKCGRYEWTDYQDWVLGHDMAWQTTKQLFYHPGNVENYPKHQKWGNHKQAYSSVGFAHLGFIFANIYGLPAADLLVQKLFLPIGVSDVAFNRPPSDEIKWFTAGSVTLMPRDYARFAYLLLREGQWEDKQIVPAKWLKTHREKPNYPNMRSNVDGYFGENYPRDMFRIFGAGGNFAYIIPSLDLIALRSGRLPQKLQKEVEQQFLELLFDSIKTPADK